jgi:L-fucose mutarotase/ribose pyranase (RbsD/FucU family)
VLGRRVAHGDEAVVLVDAALVVEVGGRLREMPQASMDRKIDALLELFGLSDAAEQGIAQRA